MKFTVCLAALFAVVGLAVLGALHAPKAKAQEDGHSNFTNYRAPAGMLPAAPSAAVGGYDVAVLPTGRLVTPAGREVSALAPKPYGMALSPDGQTLLTINSGTRPFSLTLIRNVNSAPTPTLIPLDATFMGVVFSADGSTFYASGGEDGLIWVGRTATGAIQAVVNLNIGHPLGSPINPAAPPPNLFRGSFLGNIVLGADNRTLYVVDQASFSIFAIDTSRIDLVKHGLASVDPNNFGAVLGSVRVGRYPFGLAASSDGHSLFVSHVGVFQWTHLTPANPTGDPNRDYPLGYPAFGYPGDSETAKTIRIQEVDPRNLPPTERIPDGIRVGYVLGTQQYTVPGVGSPNVPESSSVYVLETFSNAARLVIQKIVKTGPLVGSEEFGISTFGGSHPNAVAVGKNAVYVSNGNNDTVSILDGQTFAELRRIYLTELEGQDARLKGVQPVALTVSPDGRRLYVAEAGINAVGVVELNGTNGRALGHIPTAWWPSRIEISRDGQTLYIANARGRGALPNTSDPPGSPRSSTLGSVTIVPVPTVSQMAGYTERVLANNGFAARATQNSSDPIPNREGVGSREIKHVIFINKENSTYDQLLGDITVSRRGTSVNGFPAYSLGLAASPNHHELALQYTVGDNFYLEPSVSSDGHRWLTNTYPTEFEDTHWPASYGGRRSDSGDNPAIYNPYPGRLGFSGANGTPDPNDYDQHGSIYVHLARNGKTFANFGNGQEFALGDEDRGTEPTGIRQHVNIPMEKVLRDNSDHLYPEFNTHIPDSPLPEDPGRFNRFGRFKQIFEAHYVNRAKQACSLPSYVDLYYPNDHGGGANDINRNGPAWSYRRFVQDNDASLGLTVDLISHSPCWNNTVIFVVEDDTQNGLDHVNGARSIFLAIGPWIKRENVAKLHYSLSSIFKTVNLILGIPPLNQYDAAATDLRDIFTNTPDFTPYSAVPVQFARGANRTWIAMTKGLDLSKPDNDELRLRAAILASEGLPRRK